jgi:signal transduction histidine kinase
LEALGIKPGELVGKSHFERYRDFPELVEPVRRALNGENLTAPNLIRGRWYETSYGPSRDETGEITGVVAVSTDISERKIAEEERERVANQFEAVLEQMPAGVLIAQAPNGEVILSNKQVEKIWRQPSLAQNSLLQNGRYQGFHPDGTPLKTEEWPLHRALNKGELVVDEEINTLRGDGTTGTISVSAAPIKDKAGNITAAVVVFIDITERKYLENQKDEFIGIASHELKTPVTSLKAYGQVLQTLFKRKGDAKAVEQLAKMDTQINKLTGLIRDLLDVTKLQAGKLQFQEEFFDFNELVNEIVEELQRTTEQHTIIKELNPTRLIYGDRERTGQVLTNLISNAIKYSPYSDKIIVRSVLDPQQLTLSVQDFGIGIDHDKQTHIFDRFYRVSGHRQETFPGLGLGLYISSQIIARQGGRIWVESTPGEGSIFYFSLPVPIPEPLSSGAFVEMENIFHE